MPDGELPREPSRTDRELAEIGRGCMIRDAGEEAVRLWSEPNYAEVELTISELEDLALSMGHHRNFIRDEGKGAAEAGFDDRACGLFFAVDRTNALLQRIRGAHEQAQASETGIGRFALSQFDFVNLLGTESYRRVADDHATWLSRLGLTLVAGSELLTQFRQDFDDLARSLPNTQRKIAELRPRLDSANEVK